MDFEMVTMSDTGESLSIGLKVKADEQATLCQQDTPPETGYGLHQR